MTVVVAGPETGRQADNEPGVGLRRTWAVRHGLAEQLLAVDSDFDTSGEG